MSSLDVSPPSRGALRRAPGILVLTLLVMNAVSSCGAPDHAVVYPIPESSPCPSGVIVSELADGSVRFCGNITQSSVGEAIAYLDRAKKKRLVIDSTGGSIPDAMQLARYLRQQDVELYVNLLCLSACAQYLVLGTNAVSFRPASVVAFHNTQLATNLLSGRSGDADDPMIQLAREEAEFFREIGVPLEFAYAPMATLSPECLLPPSPNQKPGKILVRMKHTYVMPNAASFQAMFRGDLLTPWPQRDAVEAALTGRFKGKLNIDYAPFDLTPLTALPGCP